MGNCSPKTFHYESPPRPDIWYIDGQSILPEPLEIEYKPRPLYQPIWLRPLPDYLEPLKPLKDSQDLSQDSQEIKPFRGKLAPLKLC